MDSDDQFGSVRFGSGMIWDEPLVGIETVSVE